MEEKFDSVLLNIVLLPDKLVNKEIINFSKSVSKLSPVEFKLNQTNNFPHITIYQAEFPKSNLKKIVSTIKYSTSKINRFNLTLNKISFFNNFLFWNIKKTDKILKIHESIVEKLNPLRKGLIKKDLFKVKNLYNGYKNDIKKYGSLLIGKNYIPHMTITCFKKILDKNKILSSLKDHNRKINIKSIYIGILGKFGTVNKILYRFDLMN